MNRHDPVLFRIGEFEITSFGVLVAVAAVADVSDVAGMPVLRRSTKPGMRCQ